SPARRWEPRPRAGRPRWAGPLGPAAVLAVTSGLVAPGLVRPPLASAQSSSLVVQSTAEPPGLDLTATPASATATVVFYNIQEALVKVDAQGRLLPWLPQRRHTTPNLDYPSSPNHRHP